VMKLGWAIGKVLAKEQNSKVVIGKDTRISGYMFESALEAGLSAAGVDIHLLGPMPTPGIAYLTKTLHAQAGIVISASHNPFRDNGIKFFSPQGTKLADEIELAIEEQLDEIMGCAGSDHLGKAVRVDDAAGRYIEYCKSRFPDNQSLAGMKIVLDCANGATYHIAPKVFEELGAEVIAIGNEPDGYNINEACGSTHPEWLQKNVKVQEADIGIAFDGDGDRVIMVDNQGNLVDGDQLIYIIARHKKRQGQFDGGVVGTLMTNLGMEHALAKLGIPLKRANVGDRYVMEQLLENHWVLGGENSGHIICLDQTSTGDGIIAALQVLAALVESGESLAESIRDLTMYPQVLENVRLNKKQDVAAIPEVKTEVTSVEAELADRGRVLLRASGTEPLIRVMVEGEDAALVQQCAQRIANTVRKSLSD
ncbi:MAG: phosphoglucosamine mutase, partial [Thioalkalispiraceae bacterium]